MDNIFAVDRKRQTVTREKVKQKERLKKHREKRYGKSDEKAMANLLLEAKTIIFS